MNLILRTAIAKICIAVFYVRARTLLFNAKVIMQFSKLSVWIGRARAKRHIKPYREAVDDFQKRSNALLSELKNFNELPENRRQQVLATRSSLMEEAQSLKTIIAKLAPIYNPGATAIVYVANRAMSKVQRLEQRYKSLSRILSTVNSANFYWDVLLWLVGGSEAMLGDLNEEYLLRIANDGEPGARAWYCDQAISTARDYLWKKIERLAAVGALIDLIDRWFKK